MTAVAPPDDAACMSVAACARALGVNRKTVYASIASGGIPCRRLGRRILIPRGALAAWLRGSPSL
ncbi:MAG TPA: helix-turn-helix domain-containing protein [Kofleriaceae bacterium]|jgi:excisionase family DNA binding protein